MHDIVLHMKGKSILIKSEYGMTYIVQNGCRQEVRSEGQM